MVNVSYDQRPILEKKFWCVTPFLNESLKNPKNHYFLIRDPFNNTYNPAKNFTFDQAEKC